MTPKTYDLDPRNREERLFSTGRFRREGDLKEWMRGGLGRGEEVTTTKEGEERPGRREKKIAMPSRIRMGPRRTGARNAATFLSIRREPFRSRERR